MRQAQEKPLKPNLAYLFPEQKSEGDHKFLLKEEDVTIGVCEVNGNNPGRTQEDAYLTDTSSISQLFMSLPLAERELVANAIFAALQEEVKNEERGGSCACVATGQIKDGKAIISTSYVGDSVAFLVGLNAKGSLKFIKPCNPQLHDAENDLECANIEMKHPNAIGIDGRLDGVLAVTRAVGDNALHDKGLSHTPETTETVKDIDATDRVFMVIACDGAMEHCRGRDCVNRFSKELGNIFEENSKASPDTLAEKIVDNALKNGSQDNITVIVVLLTMDGHAVIAGVFDGHDGANVSNVLKQKYHEKFEEKVQRVEQLVNESYSARAKQKAELDALFSQKNILMDVDTLLEDAEKKLKEIAEQRFYKWPTRVIQYYQKRFSECEQEHKDYYKHKLMWCENKFKYVFQDKFAPKNKYNKNLLSCKKKFLAAYAELTAEIALLTGSVHAKTTDKTDNKMEHHPQKETKKETKIHLSWSLGTVGAVGGAIGGAVEGGFIGATLGASVMPAEHGIIFCIVLGAIVGALGGSSILGAIGYTIGMLATSKSFHPIGNYTMAKSGEDGSDATSSGLAHRIVYRPTRIEMTTTMLTEYGVANPTESLRDASSHEEVSHTNATENKVNITEPPVTATMTEQEPIENKATTNEPPPIVVHENTTTDPKNPSTRKRFRSARSGRFF